MRISRSSVWHYKYPTQKFTAPDILLDLGIYKIQANSKIPEFCFFPDKIIISIDCSDQKVLKSAIVNHL